MKDGIAALCLAVLIQGAFVNHRANAQATQMSSQQKESAYSRIQELAKDGKYVEALKLGDELFYKQNSISDTDINELSILAMVAYAESVQELGRYFEALPLNLRTLGLSKKVLGEEHPATLASLGNLAMNYILLGHYGVALPLSLQTLELREKVLGVENKDTLTSLNNLALNLIHLGADEKALPLNIRALELRKKVLGAEHSDVVNSLNHLAVNYGHLGQYDSALPLNLQALELSMKVHGAEHPVTLTILSNLAGTYINLGQYQRALPLNIRALELSERNLGTEHPDTLISLSNLAWNYRYLGQYKDALTLNQRALEVSQKVLGEEHPNTLSIQNNLAGNYSVLGQYDKALQLHLRVLELREKVLGALHPDTLISLSNLASNYSDLGQYEKALPLSQSALEVSQTGGTLNPQIVALYWSNYSYFLQQIGNTNFAIVALKNAINLYQSMRERVSGLGDESLRAYTLTVQSVYQALVSFLSEQGRLAEAQQVLDMLEESEQFDFIRRSGDADPRHARIGYTPTEQKWMDRYQRISGELSALGSEKRELEKQAKIGLNEQQKARLKKLEEDIKVGQLAFNKFLAEMREDFAARGLARKVELVDTSEKANKELIDLVRSLGDDVALLRYFVTDDQVGMLLTTAGNQVARSTNINSKELNRQVQSARLALRDPKSKPDELLKSLFQTLLGPVEKDLEQAGVKTVMMAPDGVLRYLPFGALHDGQRYATERWKLPLYNSLVKDKLREATQNSWQAAGLGVTRKVEDFAALPAVRSELSSIVKTKGSAGIMDGEVYLDDAFTAESIRNVGKRKFELMHVASHFRFSPGTEVNSFLLLGDGQHLTLGDIRTQNYRFDNVDLLTLSACDTGLGGGRDEKGVEIQGFGVIAQQQGAKAVLATLWQVADKSTASLMADMYRKRQTWGLSKIEALRQAQLALMKQPGYGHPFYWAPFILLGNWK